MRLSELNRFASVDERDIDFILLEELYSEPEFVSWFSEKAGATAREIEFVGAWHSVSDSEGESDVTLIVNAGGLRTGIMIENKIDAPAQPYQADRYKSRGAAYTQRGEWKQCLSCIVAPAKYLQSDSETLGYNARVSYEEVQEWLRLNTPETRRRQFRLDVISAAIGQNRRGRVKHTDERVAMFLGSDRGQS